MSEFRYLTPTEYAKRAKLREMMRRVEEYYCAKAREKMGLEEAGTTEQIYENVKQLVIGPLLRGYTELAIHMVEDNTPATFRTRWEQGYMKRCGGDNDFYFSTSGTAGQTLNLLHEIGLTERSPEFPSGRIKDEFRN